MRPWKTIAGLLALAVLSLAMVAGGRGLRSGLNVLLRETPTPTLDWSVSVVDFGLVGVILVLLALLTAVLARGPYAPEARAREAREAQMVQDLFHGFALMEKRLDSLEAQVLQRAGRFAFGPKSN